MKPIIEVNHVWKEYEKGIDRKYKSLRDTIAGMPGRWLGEDKEKFWALEDINFNVEAGESVGIIGRNGAGKSTLLKIMSRITPPTQGEIILRGRVASLLEVGTGFHPELTGRENVYFNGSILGMKHQEIKKKFDEIVDFSGVERFIETPLKHYSSGMQMRLAFSVAAHLDAEILLIDEVLAVGDAEFQKKCIGKMDEVSKGKGKSILFVSHDLKIIEKLCTISCILDNSNLIFSGKTSDSTKFYNKLINTNISNDCGIIDFGKKIGKKTKLGIMSAKIKCNDNVADVVYPGCNLKLELEIFKNSDFINPEVGFAIRDSFGSYLFGLNNNHMNKTIKSNKRMLNITFEFKHFPIYKNGCYYINFYFGDADIVYEILMDAAILNVKTSNYYNSEKELDPFYNLIIDKSLSLSYN